MRKKDIINMESIAYYSGFSGLEIKHIEYGIDDYIYCVSGVWNGKPRCHKLKVYYDKNGDDYIRLHGYKVLLNECIRMGVC